MRPPAATSRGLSPRVATPASVVWRSTRHLFAEIGYPGKINNHKTDIVVDGIPRLQRWAGGMVRFFLLIAFLICRAAAELRYRSWSDAQSQSLFPHTTTRCSRKWIHPASVPYFLLQITNLK